MKSQSKHKAFRNAYKRHGSAVYFARHTYHRQPFGLMNPHLTAAMNPAILAAILPFLHMNRRAS